MADEKQTSPIEPQTAPQSPETTPALRDKRILPEGVVPKQAQGYVIAGLAVLILMAVMFSKNHAKPAAKDVPSGPLAMSTDVNQRKIQELEQDLSADQRQSQQQAPAQKNMSATTTPGGVPSPMQPNGAVNGTVAPTPVSPPATPPSDPVADAEKALAFKSRFASNLVSAEESASHPSAEPVGLSEGGAARSSSLPPIPPTQATAAPAAANKRAPEINLNAAHGQPYAVFEGTNIDTVLVDRLDGEFAGDVKVMVTNPVYSEDRQHVLIPEGTFILGTVQKVSGLGQKRLALTFHRMLMPDKYSVDLDHFHGLDQAGETGVKDKVNNHYVEIFGASIALGVISGAAEATNLNEGYNESGTEAYKAGIVSSLSQSSANVLDRFINIPPAITIRNGHRIKIYITQDMLLPAYENHDMSSVM
ncbi:MAG TPA: TrbI/VirB10 family protein [Edaphobacter sp.]|nr:TrbI/VirB10 family protein [Edaphobacter sp.]